MSEKTKKATTKKKAPTASAKAKTTKKDTEKDKFKGKYIQAVGRRKNATAQVRIYDKGKGDIVVNGKDVNDYFTAYGISVIKQPLKLSNLVNDLNISVVVKGGGFTGQAEAIRLGLARALAKKDEELVIPLKAKGYITRDARRVERKKPGLKKARRSPQWSKR
jgi:small subunit ribosomal protein S9